MFSNGNSFVTTQKLDLIAQPFLRSIMTIYKGLHTECFFVNFITTVLVRVWPEIEQWKGLIIC